MEPSPEFAGSGPIRPMTAPGKGRGVFAVTDIAQGQIVETSCTIELGVEDCQIVKPTPVEDYYFEHPEDKARGLVVLGLASLCNHSESPNVDTSFRKDGGLGWITVLTANRPIAKGEEITRRYACPPWFKIAS